MLLLVIAFIDVVAPKRAVCFVVQANHLCSLSADSAGQLNVLRHDGDSLGMDGTQVGVLKETNEVSLASFLKSHDSKVLSFICNAVFRSLDTHQYFGLMEIVNAKFSS